MAEPGDGPGVVLGLEQAVHELELEGADDDAAASSPRQASNQPGRMSLWADHQPGVLARRASSSSCARICSPVTP